MIRILPTFRGCVCRARLCLFLFFSAIIVAQNRIAPPEFNVPGLIVDPEQAFASLDASVWQGARVVSDFFQTSPGENLPPSQQALLKVFHDNTSLWVAVRCLDTQPGLLRRERFRRDDVPASAEGITISLDPSGMAHQVFWIRVTPFNDVADGVQDLVRGGMGQELDFEFHSTVHRHAQGYDVVVRIPFASLPIPATVGAQNWYIAVDRTVPRTNLEQISLVPLNRGSSDPRDYLARITMEVGSNVIKTWHFIPTAVASLNTTEASETGQPDERESWRKGNVELTGWWTPRPSTRASFTINPDFSQIEADDVYQRINNRYPVFIPEKRPFFLDPNDPFRTTGFTLVNTRAIVDPFLGVRYFDHRDAVGLYALSAIERNTPSERFGLPSGTVRDTSWNIFAGKWSNPKGSLGLLATSMDYGGTFNRVTSLDGDVRWGNLGVKFQEAFTQTRLGDAPQDVGKATFLQADYRLTGWFSLGGSYKTLSQNFNTMAGFEPEVGIEKRTAYVDFNFRPSRENALVKGYSLDLRHQRKDDWSGQLVEEFVQASQILELPSRLMIFLNLLDGREAFLGTTYNQRDTSLTINWSRYEHFGLGVFGSRFHTIFYNPANPRSVDGGLYGLTLNQSFEGFTLKHRWQRVRLNETNGSAWAAKQDSFQTTLQLVFGEGMSIRIFHTWDRAEWADFGLENPQAYFQALFTYQPSTFTRFFVGFNLRSSEQRIIGTGQSAVARENRYFIKWAYSI